jgi:hypothetical protein
MQGSATALEQVAPDVIEEPRQAEHPQRAMEQYAGRLRDLILSQPPRKLIGYIWARSTLGGPDSADAAPGADAESTAFLLQYVHAVLACHENDAAAQLNEAACEDIIACAGALQAATRAYCDSLAPEGADEARRAEFVAKSSWVSPVQRPEALQEEFLAFVLDPHDEALRRRHGIGTADIIKRLLALPDTMRSVQQRAAEAIEAQMADVGALAEERGVDTEEAARLWNDEQPEKAKAAARAYVDLLEGGLCNLSAHTDLPIALLRDLSDEQGSEKSFFAPGTLCGTPLRTLPARAKPLVKLRGDYFALDSGFLRGAAHRALLSGLAADDADFTARQNTAIETAFSRALSDQLEGARIDTGICYRDTQSHQWAENDLLVRLDDVLILVDAKAGAAATVAPPPVDFEQHVQNVLKLVAGAYERCRRFLDYLASAPEVPIFRRNGGRTVEYGRIRLGDYRMVLPISLTLEPFAPVSAMCSALPSIRPILGRHAFMALSLDDLLVLRRVLPTRAEFLDYMRFRQEAGAKSPPRYFEADHLADYAALVPDEAEAQPAEEVSAADDPVPEAEVAAPVAEPIAEIAEPETEIAAPEIEEPDGPEPERPREVANLLAALKAAGEPGAQRARDAIRRRDAAGCQSLAVALRQAAGTLATQEFRFLYDSADPPLFIWLQRFGTRADLAAVRAKAKAAAIAAGTSSIIAVLAHATAPGEYSRAVSVGIIVPAKDSAEYARFRAEAAAAQERAARERLAAPAAPHGKIGRNEPCWCGSGKKFKRCHGQR